MKPVFLGCLAIGILAFTQCSHDGAVTPVSVPKVDYNATSIKIMDELTPQVSGRWTLQQVYVKAQRYSINDRKLLGFTKDTVFQNLAVLDVHPPAQSRFSPKDPRYAEFEGSLTYHSKTYPVYFYLLANAERVVSNKGPQAFFLFEYNFPSGSSHRVEPEEAFINALGLIDNFSLETVAGQPTMIWRGLNRGIDRIEFQKQ